MHNYIQKTYNDCVCFSQKIKLIIRPNARSEIGPATIVFSREFINKFQTQKELSNKMYFSIDDKEST